MYRHNVISTSFSTPAELVMKSEEILDGWGKSGWELITVVIVQDVCIFFFKISLQEE